MSEKKVSELLSRRNGSSPKFLQILPRFWLGRNSTLGAQRLAPQANLKIEHQLLTAQTRLDDNLIVIHCEHFSRSGRWLGLISKYSLAAKCLASILSKPDGSWSKLDEWYTFDPDQRRENSRPLLRSSTQAEYVSILFQMMLRLFLRF